MIDERENNPIIITDKAGAFSDNIHIASAAIVVLSLLQLSLPLSNNNTFFLRGGGWTNMWALFPVYDNMGCNVLSAIKKINNNNNAGMKHPAEIFPLFFHPPAMCAVALKFNSSTILSLSNIDI